MEQQQAFNRLVAQMLAAQARARDEVRTNAGDLDRLTEALLAWQAESRATMDTVAERLAAIEERLARLEGDED
jgi:hypothetical protein